MIYEIIKVDGTRLTKEKREPEDRRSRAMFTSSELMEKIGGLFTLRWVYSEPHVDTNGINVETKYWMCSWDANANDNSKRPPINNAAMKSFNIEDPIYGDAIVAQSTCF